MTKKQGDKMDKKLREALKECEVLYVRLGEDMKDAAVQDEDAALRFAVNLLLFVNNMEALYKKVFKIKMRKCGNYDILREIVDNSTSETFLAAFKKIKIFRNIIAHNVSFVEPVLNYFTNNLKGMTRICHTRNRLFVVLQAMREDAYYAARPHGVEG